MRKLTTQEWVAVGAAIVVAAILFFGGTIWSAFNRGFMPQSAATSTPQTTMQNISTVPGLEIYDEQVGTGTAAVAGQIVTVNYTGYLANGTKFDSSFDHGQPFSFPLGAGQVIKGWDLGVQGMKVGGLRKLVISPDLGYGARGAGNLIPPNSTLVFEVQLLGVK